MAKTVAKVSKKQTVKKTKNTKKCKIEFNKYSPLFQTASMIFLIAAIVLNVCGCISINVMLDLFSLSILSIAFSLFPKRSLK